MHIKKNDKVMVIAGKDKTKSGIVMKVLPKRNRVVVEGVNIVKKHQKPTNDNQSGGIMEIEAPIHASNVQLICPDTGKKTRVRYEFKDGKKVRVSVKSGNPIDR